MNDNDRDSIDPDLIEMVQRARMIHDRDARPSPTPPFGSPQL
ncbi:MAG: hypothetical protein DIU68_017820 [Chloroflexota bacterium]